MLDGEIAKSEVSTRAMASFFANSKGGIGKSHCASLLAQWAKSRGRKLQCFDGDATTATLSGFKALQAVRLELMAAGSIINPRKLDDFVEVALTEDQDVLLDTGTSTYVVFMRYALESSLFELINDSGKEVVVHVIVVGGSTLVETINDLDNLASQLPEFVTLVVWLNEHFGLIEQGGKTFEDMAVYSRHKSRIYGIIRLNQLSSQTFGEDISQMMSRNLTFAEAIKHHDFSIVSKSRLKRTMEDIFKQLDAVMVR